MARCAISSGAIAAVITPQAAAKQPPTKDTCLILVEDMVSACGELAAAFYNCPAQKLKMIGVTGTNGKNYHYPFNRIFPHSMSITNSIILALYILVGLDLSKLLFILLLLQLNYKNN